MKNRLALIRVKIILSARSVWWVLSRPKYAVLAVVVMILFFELTYWLFNLDVLTLILSSSNVSLAEKLNVLMSPIDAVKSTSGSFLVGMMLLLSVLQGVAISILVFYFKNQKQVDAKLVGGSTAVGVLAVIGLGCPACGTSLVTPIVALFVSSSAPAISEDITNVALPLAILVAIFGIYVLGIRIANIRATQSGNLITIVNKE